MFSSYLRKTMVRLSLALLLVTIAQPTVYGQTGESPQEMKKNALALVREQKIVQSLPIWEQLALATPNDPDVQFNLGFALIAKTNITNDSAQRKALRIRARQAFVRAKALGQKEPVLEALIEGLPE